MIRVWFYYNLKLINTCYGHEQNTIWQVSIEIMSSMVLSVDSF